MLNSMIKSGVFKHIKCRNNIYPKSEINRFIVPDDRVYWTVKFPEYLPPIFTASFIKGQSWADPDIEDENFNPKWNCLDGNVNRKSYTVEYEIKDGHPLNPIGRTGIRGRGILGRWGPNHAADPIVTRWKRKQNGEFIISPKTNKKILQMIAIQRHDNNMWAIPGGMVDPGEKVSSTLKREFIEEALNSKGDTDKINEFFSKNGIEVYKGYVDDFRNTDNAWMETVAYNFHDENGDNVGSLNLSAGYDAKNVKWMDLNGDIELHASHSLMIEEVARRLDAHW